MKAKICDILVHQLHNDKVPAWIPNHVLLDQFIMLIYFSLNCVSVVTLLTPCLAMLGLV